ncbi:MAG: CPBP family intramembrane metalloprotease [Alteromonadaceae bacterium]|nr:CPBP family intramembrane metalloprotease [Alteromonadaceae bacterium]
MIGIILLVASWLLLRLEGKPISVLGFNRPVQRSLELVLGFVVASLFACTHFMLQAHFSEFSWVRNPDLGLAEMLEGLRWTTNSVLYEELLFRGYLLYKAIEILGTRKGCLLSAAAFGVYHWFSYGVLGSVVPMAFVFIMTGTFGLMAAYAYAKSRSVVLPIALHLGWNVAAISIFSNGPIGAQLLIPFPSEGAALSATEQILANVLVPIALPLLVLWLVVWRLPFYAKSEASDA